MSKKKALELGSVPDHAGSEFLTPHVQAVFIVEEKEVTYKNILIACSWHLPYGSMVLVNGQRVVG